MAELPTSTMKALDVAVPTCCSASGKTLAYPRPARLRYGWTQLHLFRDPPDSVAKRGLGREYGSCLSS